MNFATRNGLNKEECKTSEERVKISDEKVSEAEDTTISQNNTNQISDFDLSGYFSSLNMAHSRAEPSSSLIFTHLVCKYTRQVMKIWILTAVYIRKKKII